MMSPSNDDQDRSTPENKTWVLTGCLENFQINVERGFDVIGLKERRRKMAESFAPGDSVIFYVTGIQSFGGIASVTSEMFEDREPIWPQGKKKAHEDYPWRVKAEPDLILPEEAFVPVVDLLDDLEHTQKWPREHWHLAFQGQLRIFNGNDVELVRGAMEGALAGAPG